LKISFWRRIRASYPRLSIAWWIIPRAEVSHAGEIFHAKSIRHKTAYKADNIARRWAMVPQRSRTLRG
jgi:hypothetical protein